MAKVLLKNVPADVHAILLDKQTEIKKKKKVWQYSLSATISQIVREWKEIKDKSLSSS